jgi:hypothetical protein
VSTAGPGFAAVSRVLTPGVFIGLAIFWVVTCGLVLRLAWRAARSDAQAPPGGEESGGATHPGTPTDRAA